MSTTLTVVLANIDSLVACYFHSKPVVREITESLVLSLDSWLSCTPDDPISLWEKSVACTYGFSENLAAQFTRELDWTAKTLQTTVSDLLAQLSYHILFEKSI